MTRFSKFLLKILTNSLIISAVSLMVGYLSREGSPVQKIFGGIGFYGAIITFYIFLFHLLMVLFIYLLRWSEKQNGE